MRDKRKRRVCTNRSEPIAIAVTITDTLYTLLLNCPHPLFTFVASGDDVEKTPKELAICSVDKEHR